VKHLERAFEKKERRDNLSVADCRPQVAIPVSQCPVKPAQMSEQPQKHASTAETDKQVSHDSSHVLGSTAEKQFRSVVATESARVYTALHKECDSIEEQIQAAQQSVLKKNQIAFLMRKHEIEYSQLKSSLV
jgi:hypothetical protein